MRDFRSLTVWEKAHQTVLDVYRASASFPMEERFGVTSQLRRAMVSVPTNIAEGCGRGTQADFNRFLQIAMGSASEVSYLLLLSRDLTILPESEFAPLSGRVDEVSKMLASLIRKIQRGSGPDGR